MERKFGSRGRGHDFNNKNRYYHCSNAASTYSQYSYKTKDAISDSDITHWLSVCNQTTALFITNLIAPVNKSDTSTCYDIKLDSTATVSVEFELRLRIKNEKETAVILGVFLLDLIEATNLNQLKVCVVHSSDEIQEGIYARRNAFATGTYELHKVRVGRIALESNVFLNCSLEVHRSAVDNIINIPFNFTTTKITSTTTTTTSTAATTTAETFNLNDLNQQNSIIQRADRLPAWPDNPRIFVRHKTRRRFWMESVADVHLNIKKPVAAINVLNKLVGWYIDITKICSNEGQITYELELEWNAKSDVTCAHIRAAVESILLLINMSKNVEV
jgi:hypothetical protein